ncbi:fungal-specific transcription factor [Podospora appendiculata]|uniref:Fungal-specific transcription factor n=1 Tax=Podospora appendiculata TaxID=314037 RepID=A0AAE1CAK4_9PEZI|nr:fungal-specific transcription factor [Podospora appendiculata]
MATPSRPRQRKIGSRSCDACKIRKVKCSEAPPCTRCVAVGLDCTFNKTQSARGPRTLRARTLQQIQEAQQGRPAPTENQQPEAATSEITKTAPRKKAQGEPAKPPEITVESLVLRLCIYRLRLFPVWPIVAVEEVIAALQRDAHDIETFALAAAVGAATMAQLKLDRFADTGVNDSATAASLEAECQRIRRDLDGGIANLNWLRTSFFLHIYHENREAGGTKSLLYLREAITLAQIMGLHRASSYLTLDTAEDRLRRRILWLLFVTERGVAMLHKLPVILTAAENLPPLDISGSEDEAHILPAFKKLVNLFWIFDQSRALDILQDAADGLGGGALGTGSASLNYEMLHALQKRLQDASLEMENGSSDIQKADIYVTRQWMQVLLWRATMSDWRVSISPPSSMVERPIQIAQQFLDFISQLPNAALEAHGPAIEFKVYEIASAVADSLATQLNLPSTTPVNLRPSDILLRLQRILATSRGGNSSLLGLLAARISRVRTPPSYSITDFDMSPPQSQTLDDAGNEINTQQRWVMDATSSLVGQSLQARTRSQPSPSPSSWLSLVASAEVEQQSIAFGSNDAANSSVESPNGARVGAGDQRTAMNWSAHPLGLLSQLCYIDASLTSDGSSLPSGDALVDMLANQNWLLGLNGPR